MHNVGIKRKRNPNSQTYILQWSMCIKINNRTVKDPKKKNLTAPVENTRPAPLVCPANLTWIGNFCEASSRPAHNDALPCLLKSTSTASPQPTPTDTDSSSSTLATENDAGISGNADAESPRVRYRKNRAAVGVLASDDIIIDRNIKK